MLDVFGIDVSKMSAEPALAKIRLQAGLTPALTFFASDGKVAWTGEARFQLTCDHGYLGFKASESAWTEHSQSWIRGKLLFSQTTTGELVVFATGREFGAALMIVPFTTRMNAWFLFETHAG